MLKSFHISVSEIKVIDGAVPYRARTFHVHYWMNVLDKIHSELPQNYQVDDLRNAVWVSCHPLCFFDFPLPSLSPFISLSCVCRYRQRAVCSPAEFQTARHPSGKKNQNTKKNLKNIPVVPAPGIYTSKKRNKKQGWRSARWRRSYEAARRCHDTRYISLITQCEADVR